MKNREALAILFLVLAACAPASEVGKSSTGKGSATTGGEGGAGPSSTVDAGSGGLTTTVGSGSGSGGGDPGVPVVYGNSPDTLYRLDPTTKAITAVGQFQGCTYVTDIALDKDSNLYGTTDTGLYAIDTTTVKCTLIASGSFPNSLSFVPAGTVDPNQEALVGYLGATYVRIDPTTGKVTTIGGITSNYGSSGDIVSVKGGKTFLTVYGPGCEDCLVEVNPTTGDLVKNWGPVGHGAVYGLAFWDGKAYGFDDGGEVFEINFAMGKLTTIPIAIPGNPTLEFYGAGSTTSAPVGPIPE